ncbi:MAG: hypothetical protein NTW04_05610, partial [Elusimicrobia bacterium]|nr:hypothetical protein [Elusimicrobiota bacterium]
MARLIAKYTARLMAQLKPLACAFVFAAVLVLPLTGQPAFADNFSQPLSDLRSNKIIVHLIEEYKTQGIGGVCDFNVPASRNPGAYLSNAVNNCRLVAEYLAFQYSSNPQNTQAMLDAQTALDKITRLSEVLRGVNPAENSAYLQKPDLFYGYYQSQKEKRKITSGDIAQALISGSDAALSAILYDIKNNKSIFDVKNVTLKYCVEAIEKYNKTRNPKVLFNAAARIAGYVTIVHTPVDDMDFKARDFTKNYGLAASISGKTNSKIDIPQIALALIKKSGEAATSVGNLLENVGNSAFINQAFADYVRRISPVKVERPNPIAPNGMVAKTLLERYTASMGMPADVEIVPYVKRAMIDANDDIVKYNTKLPDGQYNLYASYYGKDGQPVYLLGQCRHNEMRVYEYRADGSSQLIGGYNLTNGNEFRYTYLGPKALAPEMLIAYDVYKVEELENGNVIKTSEHIGSPIVADFSYISSMNPLSKPISWVSGKGVGAGGWAVAGALGGVFKFFGADEMAKIYFEQSRANGYTVMGLKDEATNLNMALGKTPTWMQNDALGLMVGGAGDFMLDNLAKWGAARFLLSAFANIPKFVNMPKINP